MKVFVINLPTAIERRKGMIKHLTARGVPFELIDGVNGRQLADDEIERMCDMEVVRKYKWMTKGFLGAVMSHYFLYKKIVDENIECACILEDDVVVGRDFLQTLDAIEKRIKEEPFVLLHYTSWNKIELENMQKPLHGNTSLYKVKDTDGLNSAAGYVVTHDVAKKMLDFLTPIRYGADNWHEFIKEGVLSRAVCVHPRPVNIRYLKSTIDYVSDDSAIVKITNFVNTYKVFPFYQLLKLRRMQMNKKMDRVAVIN